MPVEGWDSTFVLILGPVTIGALVAGLIWWLQSRRSKPPPS